MPQCRNCGAPVKAAKLEDGTVVGLENQPDVFRSGDKADGFFVIIDGRRSPMIIAPKSDDLPGAFFRAHECDARI